MIEKTRRVKLAVFVRGQIGYDIFISRALAPFAHQMVSQVRIDTVSIYLPWVLLI